MKRNLFFTAVIALMAVSCSQDQIVGLQEDTPIEFRIILDKQSKATSYTASNLASFNVTAWKTGESHTNSAHINQVDYDRGTDGSYTSASKYYWPASGGLTFYAYAPKASSTNGITRSSEVAYNVTPLDNTDNQVDFLFAKNSGTKDVNGSGMALNFRHAMSQIRVKVKNSNSALKFNVTGWKIAGVDGTATFTFDDVVENTSTVAANSLNTISAAMWSGNSDSYTASYSKTVTSKSVTSTNSSWGELDGSAILIPQTAPMATGYTGTDPTSNPLSGAYLAIEYQALNTDNNAELVASGTWGCWPVQFEWAPGFRYNYIIDLAEFGYKEQGTGELDPVMDDAEVKFVTVTIDSWQPEDDNDAEVNLPLAVYTPPASLRFSTVNAAQTNTLSLNKGTDVTGTSLLEYSLDEGSTWTTLAYGTPVQFGNGTDLLVRGNNFFSNEWDWASRKRTFAFGSDDVQVACEGDLVRALIDPTATDAPTLTKEYQFAYLFEDCKCLVSAPKIEAAALSENSCYYMFKGCTGLTSAPELPSTTLGRRCYRYMFSGCTALAAAPELPATTLADECYASMFRGCTGLTSAPELPATTLISGCYSSMFSGCTLLTSAPDLPATTLPYGCYNGMFTNCDLASAPQMTVNSVGVNSCQNMFLNNKHMTSAQNVSLNATTASSNCYLGMFKNCEALNAVVALPATTLGSYCYKEMYMGCKAITAAPALNAQTMAEGCYFGMFRGCTNLTAAPALPSTSLAESCYEEMFYNCSNLSSIPVLNATVMQPYCYKHMFYICPLVTTPVALPSTTLAEDCYMGMFCGTGLTSVPELPATTLALGCYAEMFGGCTGLVTVPTDLLPALTLPDAQTDDHYGCYEGMFGGCTNLTSAPNLPATTLGGKCYYWMFYGCTSLTTAPDLLAAHLKWNCYGSMFENCSSLNYVKAIFVDHVQGYDVYSQPWVNTLFWLKGVSTTGTFVKHPNNPSPRTQAGLGEMQECDYGYESFIPKDWTIQTATN